MVFFAPRCNRLRPYLLVTVSFVFYGLSGLEHAIVLAAGILWVYVCARPKKIVQNKIWLNTIARSLQVDAFMRCIWIASHTLQTHISRENIMLHKLCTVKHNK